MRSETKNLKSQVVNGMFWKFAERFLAQGVSFLVSLVLARLLLPDDYGVVAIVTIFINIADVIISSGFSVALIQKKDATKEDFSTIFYLNLLVAILLYIVFFFGSPLIAKAYDSQELTFLLRIMALKFPISAINTIQIAYVSRTMEFKKFFFSTLIGTIVSAFVGIFMAYKGMGALSLIVQQLTNLVIDTLILWMTVPWRPTKDFSKKSLHAMAGFGIRNLATDFVGTMFNQINSFIIGLRYTKSDLAYYNKGQTVPNIADTTISSTLSSVLFPALSKVADDKKAVKEDSRRSLRLLSFILFPIMVGFIMVSKELIIVLYTEKWLPMEPYLKLMCLQSIISVIGTVDILSLKAIGKANITLRLEFIKKPLFLVTIFISLNYGIMALAWTIVINAILSIIINSFALNKYIQYNLLEKLKDCFFALFDSALMAFVLYFVKYIPLTNTILILVLKIVLGMAVYFLVAYLFRNKEFFEIVHIGKSILYKLPFFKKKRKKILTMNLKLGEKK